ncbi:MAG TPA: adenosine deaminase [Amycolatopsis sp.]|nr:adenosine deaminase [Amycolatopsis sp.]
MYLNLHSHLEGRVRPTTAAELARELRIPTPARGWAAALTLDRPADLTTYLAKVASTYPFFGHYDALARITCEAVEDAAAAGEDYLELRFGPATHTRDGFDLDAVIAAVCEGAREGSRRGGGTAAGVVVAALRRDPAERNERVARAAARFAGDGVVGFDLAGDERLSPGLDAHTAAFAIARAAGLGLTCHAAEAAPARAALEAVNRFGVTRIGHGAHVADDPGVMRELAERGVVVEVCPTSNLYTGAISRIDRHPAPVFKRAGMRMVVGDDNPRQTGSPLRAEYRILRERLGFGEADLDAVVGTSLETGFMEPSVRAALTARRGSGPGVPPAS